MKFPLFLILLTLSLSACAVPVKHAVPSTAIARANIHTARSHSASVAQGIKGIRTGNQLAVTNIDEAIKLLDTIK